jgi:FG-GAP-like repeat/FlgD Ig-like domain/FG-GAP repeat
MASQRFFLATLAVIVIAGVSFQSSPANSQQLIEPDWFVEGNQAYGGFGADVDGAGDVNGDGYADIIVGWSAYSGKLVNQGVVMVYHGGRSGPASTPDWRFEGPREISYAGSAVAGVGDVNKDGYDDVLVTVESFSETAWSAVFLFLGGTEGLSSTPDWIGTPLPENQYFYGQSIAGGGDVNGDGYDDILVGDPQYDDESMPLKEGRVYIYFGGKRGISPRPPLIFDGFGGLGWGLAFADVNGDGYDDVVMGEPRYNTNNMGSGRALVYYGFRGGVRRQPAWTFTLDGHWLSDLGYAVSGAGDVNGDGYDDILVGQPYFTGGGILCLNTYAGRANVFYGGPNGLANTPDLVIEQPHAGCDIIGFGQSLDAAGDVNGDGVDDALIGWRQNGNIRGIGFVHHGDNGGINVAPNRFFNNGNVGSLAGAGDVNGDGFDDFLASYPAHSNAYGQWVGSVSLYFGGGPSKSGGERPANPTRADSPTAPAHAALYQNQPNPFNPTTTIRYDVPAPGAHVELAVYDVAGRLIRGLISLNESSGRKTVQWDGRSDDGAAAASGVYFYRITIGDFAETRKMVLLK